MRKIPTVFKRDPDDRAHVLPVVNPDCQWVLNGEGTATRKYDGTCVRLDEDGQWWARREVRPGKAMPANYMPVTTDPVTHKVMGWEPIEQSAFAKFHAEAVNWGDHPPAPLRPGTYELVGPKINGNPERRDEHWVLSHRNAPIIKAPDRSFGAIRALVLRLHEEAGCEGIVFHHPDGRMAKIKARDFEVMPYTVTCTCDCPECAGGHGCCDGEASR
jgi:hypothetical protein